MIGMAVFVGNHIEGERTARVRAELAERAHADSELRARAYAGRLLRAHGEERRRIAHELHDAPVQLLAHLVHRLRGPDGASRAGGATPSPPALRDLALTALDELRQITRGLRPPLLDELGLMAALRALVAQSARSSGIVVRLEAPSTCPPLPPEVELALFRITQESLSTAVRHGVPNRIAVAVAVGEAGIVLTIADDGRGFTVADAVSLASTGLGLVGMRERSELLAGRYEVVSSLARGTRVEVHVPLAGAGWSSPVSTRAS